MIMPAAKGARPSRGEGPVSGGGPGRGEGRGLEAVFFFCPGAVPRLE